MLFPTDAGRECEDVIAKRRFGRSCQQSARRWFDAWRCGIIIQAIGILFPKLVPNLLRCAVKRFGGRFCTTASICCCLGTLNNVNANGHSSFVRQARGRGTPDVRGHHLHGGCTPDVLGRHLSGPMPLLLHLHGLADLAAGLDRHVLVQGGLPRPARNWFFLGERGGGRGCWHSEPDNGKAARDRGRRLLLQRIQPWLDPGRKIEVARALRTRVSYNTGSRLGAVLKIKCYRARAVRLHAAHTTPAAP